MRLTRYTVAASILLILCQVYSPSYSQLGIPITIEKPKEYEERVLRSEKSDEKKFTVPRRFVQNTVTHYNYYFNANNKLNEVLERAKTSFRDDYSRLLPFYNYSLEATATDSIQLDSVAYKASTGIALHDLRNDWVDNLYLLWGASYYFRKEFDSAYLMFQFINYAFAPKEKDGYYVTIGSKMDGNSAFSISTKEKNSLPRRLLSRPPSRNIAFIWQIRNFLAQDQFAEAASLIVTLRDDPVFPKRLQNDLHEVQALWFYKQQMWDSAAAHLVEALGNASNQQEKARWEYLAAQLYERAGQYKEAEDLYKKVSLHTTDLVLDIYARLATIRVNKDEGSKSVDKNIAGLLKMAKRDKYAEYRDIIYYMAAQMELENQNTDGALAMLLKSSQYPSNDPAQRNKVFLQLAELSFAKKKYRQAYNFYDSLKLDDPALGDVTAIEKRKDALGVLATNIEIIERQDSLQRIAAMPEDERRDFVRALARQLRRQQGLKDEGTGSSGSPFPAPGIPNDLFGAGNQKGEWYFYNAASRSRGLNEFRSKWGNRPNVDNWRRSAVVNMGNAPVVNRPGDPGNQTGADAGSGEITFDGLYNRLPLTPEQVAVSNDSISQAMFELGKVYIQQLEDCPTGTDTYEQLRTRFPGFEQMDEVLFGLYYCYHKSGETDKAEAIKKWMSEKYPESNLTTIVTTGKNPQASAPGDEATKTYEDIYDLFVEGNFAEAIRKKKSADSLYGRNYWTPQLLYIEAVYYIQQREDSTAKNVLTAITTQFAGTPLAARATLLIDVLGRRKQIEEELSKLEITRYGSDTSTRKPVTQPVTPPVTVIDPPKKDSTAKTNPVVTSPKPGTDSTKVTTAPKISTPYSHKPESPHYVVLVLNKVDPVFSNEARNAYFRYNRETYFNKTFTLDLHQLDTDNRLLLIAPFKNAQEAVDYIDKARPKTATDIIPWLKGGKYGYTVLSADNFEILKSNKDLDIYKTFLDQYFPGKF